MNIKVLGEGCERCDELYANTLEALEIIGIEARVEKVDSLLEIVKLGVMTAPSLMVDGKLVLGGRVASPKKIAKILKNYL